MRETINHVRAVGWTPDGIAIGLAQKVKVGRTFYFMSPEGIGTFEHVQEIGAFVLLRENHEVSVDLRLPYQGVQVVTAFAQPSREGFVVFARGGPGKSWCLLIGMDGHASPCAPAAWEVDRIYLAPRSGEARLRSGGLSPNATYWAVNLTTGQSSPITDAFLTLGLRMTSEPCDMSIASLSPGEDIWAVACTLVRASVRQTGIWLVRAGAQPFLLYELTTSDLDFPYPALEDRRRQFHELYGLAWSPDGSQMYWCGGGGKGVILSISDSRPQAVSRCLRLATWSPDGTRIAGVEGHQLVEMQIR